MPEFTFKDKPKRTPRQLAKQRYRVAQKVKKELSKIKTVNSDLYGIPEKTAKRVLTDEMVVDIFRLSETMLKILDFSPVEEGPRGQIFVCVSKEIRSKDRNLQKFEVERRPPTAKDVARHLLLEDHIKNLQKFTRPVTAPLEGPLAELPNLNARVRQEGYELYKKWRPDPNEEAELDS